jgi:quinol monooxygenase YgiN
VLIIIGEAEAASGHRDQMLAAVAAMATATKADEGYELYGFYADVTRPEVILSVEVWRDQAALGAHMTHSHTVDFLATVHGLVAGEPVMRFFTAESLPAPAQEEAR